MYSSFLMLYISSFYIILNLLKVYKYLLPPSPELYIYKVCKGIVMCC